MTRALTSGREHWWNAAWRCSSILLLAASAAFLGACGGGDSEPGGSTDPNTATLAWDPVTDPNLAGYRIYYGTSTGTYSQLDVGSVTTYSVTGLSRGTRYYFVATAYDTMGNESNYSNEVFKDVP